jgi:hypothetical protein
LVLQIIEQTVLAAISLVIDMRSLNRVFDDFPWPIEAGMLGALYPLNDARPHQEKSNLTRETL